MAIAKSRHEYKFSVNEKDLLMLAARATDREATPMWGRAGGYYHIRKDLF